MHSDANAANSITAFPKSGVQPDDFRQLPAWVAFPDVSNAEWINDLIRSGKDRFRIPLAQVYNEQYLKFECIFACSGPKTKELLELLLMILVLHFFLQFLVFK